MLHKLEVYKPQVSTISSILCALAMAGCAALPGGGEIEGGEVDRKTCIYAGSGAVLAKPVEVALDKLAIPCGEVDEHDIREGKLRNCSAFGMRGESGRGSGTLP